MTVPRVLVIAGSDSSGGAGLEADQKVLAAHRCYAMTATTALTAQNTLGVEDVHITPPAFVAKQIDASLSDIGCDVVKLGMLASAETIKIIADALTRHGVSTVVLDPVMVSTSGAQLLPGDAVRNLRDLLLPLTTVLTPNIPEATLLLRDADMQYKSPSNLDDLKLLAKMVYSLGPKAVLLKGGHMPLTTSYEKANSDDEKQLTVDILYDGDGDNYTIIESKYIDSKNTHGTGCSLASAIAANLALQISQSPPTPSPTLSLPTATRLAVRYVTSGISSADPTLGKGSRPINHFHNVQRHVFSRGHFIEYLLSHPKIQPVWKAYTQHEFTLQLARGTLDETVFKNYLIQDYLYLRHFARTHSLAGYKSKTMSAIAASAQIVLHIQRETDLHKTYCAEFGISETDLESPDRRESLACVAYSRYVLDIGHSQDWLALQMALAPCLLGYGEAARRLYVDPSSVTAEKGNRYWKWVENYVAEDYAQAVAVGRELIEREIVKQSPERVDELMEIFLKAAEMEVRFWDLDAHI
ncbi:hypothetical protein B0A52_01837 [Exophiala mesophila]|uniref:Phosphomethylpyrimidine kinase n=1 Tax=Exophiala mesophila TaxID=212818 RepID=A0A438NG48_EXOME|nr:hypothetical protein B0A52_01837 [Exophiala mesophila]